MTIRTFSFQRNEDISGVSGTGKVLEGVEFTDGIVVVRWLSKYASTAMYNNMKQFEDIHGHEGKGHIVWDK
jgi:hypothetical protein